MGRAQREFLKVGSRMERCRSRFDRLSGILAPSLSGLSVWPMSWERSVPKEERQTEGGIRPVVVRKSGPC